MKITQFVFPSFMNYDILVNKKYNCQLSLSKKLKDRRDLLTECLTASSNVELIKVNTSEFYIQIKQELKIKICQITFRS